jgi:hypothetical protein
MTLNIVVLTAIPKPSVITAMIVKLGDLLRVRAAYRRSCQKLCIGKPRREKNPYND